MTKRKMFRYTVPMDDTPWAFYLTSDPVHVANGISMLGGVLGRAHGECTWPP